MSSEWNAVYPKRINWQNRPGSDTPIHADNLNKGDSALREIDERVLSLGYTKIIDIPTTAWTEITQEGIYNYIFEYETTDYTDDSTPIASIYSGSENDTITQFNAMEKIGKVWCSATGVKVYATELPEVDLKLMLKGK